MTPHDLPPVTPADADRLLSEFFRREVPARWPDPPRPSSVVRCPLSQTADQGRLSRYTLAASVALLLGAGWLLTAGLSDDRKPAVAGNSDLINGARADGGRMLLPHGGAKDPDPMPPVRTP